MLDTVCGDAVLPDGGGDSLQEICGGLSTAMGKSPLTTPLVVVLSTFARLLSWEEVNRLFGASWGTVCRAVAQAVSYGLEPLEFTGVLSIGIDEISRRRGH